MRSESNEVSQNFISKKRNFPHREREGEEEAEEGEREGVRERKREGAGERVERRRGWEREGGGVLIEIHRNHPPDSDRLQRHSDRIRLIFFPTYMQLSILRPNSNRIRSEPDVVVGADVRVHL